MTTKKLSVRGIINFATYILLYPIVLFSNAGTTHWGMAWGYLGTSTGDRETRSLMKCMSSNPRQYFKYMGYGLYAGRKPL